MTPSYIGYTDEQPKRIQKAYIGVNDDPHVLLRVYVGDQSGYVKPAYVATTSSSTTYLTSAIDSSGLSSTTALTCASTSGESYLTSEETTGTSYLTDTRYAYRFWITLCQSSQFVWYSSLSYLGVEAYRTSTHKYTIDVTDLLSSTIATLNTKFYIPYGTALGNCDTYAFSYLPSGFLRLTGASKISISSHRSQQYYMNTSATKLNTVSQSGTDHLDSKTSYQLYLGDDLWATNSASSTSRYFNMYKTTTTSEGGDYRTSSYDVYDTDAGTYRTETQYFSNSGWFSYTVSRNSTIESAHTVITKKAWNEIEILAASNRPNIITRSMSLVVSRTATGVKTTGTSYLTSSAITGTSYLTRESTSAYSGVTTVTTTQPIPVPEPPRSKILCLENDKGCSGHYSNDGGLTWETITNIFPTLEPYVQYGSPTVYFHLFWIAGYFYFIRVGCEYIASGNTYNNTLDIYKIDEDLSNGYRPVASITLSSSIFNNESIDTCSFAQKDDNTIYVMIASINHTIIQQIDPIASRAQDVIKTRYDISGLAYEYRTLETIRWIDGLGLIGGVSYYNLFSPRIIANIIGYPVGSAYDVQNAYVADYVWTPSTAQCPGLNGSRNNFAIWGYNDTNKGYGDVGTVVAENNTYSFNELSDYHNKLSAGVIASGYLNKKNICAFQLGNAVVFNTASSSPIYLIEDIHDPESGPVRITSTKGSVKGCICKERIILSISNTLGYVDLDTKQFVPVIDTSPSGVVPARSLAVNCQFGNYVK